MRFGAPLRHPEPAAAPLVAESRQAAFLSAIWVCYVLGAAGGTASFLKIGTRTLLLAIIGIAVGIVTDLVRPLSIEEEREQSER
ncbi:MAG: hypothetical protein KGL02_12595 [Acidobacteriota bacterium]|nr:hypothetical protein [Acidobacteriota bacterium]